MPTYQYRCPHCHFEFEEFQHITDEPISVCPKCKKDTHRIISGGAGFIFKGSGFYITDHRSESYKSAAAKEKTQSPSSGVSVSTLSSANSDSKTSEKKT
ncbi:MAG: zinc ribbon domain-containing protein [candidate division Zixibacteria bacterium]|nr:zinc ribbon domain-containing protein [candidate division Zixibacteria bacterium]